MTALSPVHLVIFTSNWWLIGRPIIWWVNWPGYPNGEIKHNILLHEILSHAKVNNKTVQVSFFDLDDAFGSVSHELIEYSLKQYQFPTNVTSYVVNMSQRLHGIGKTNKKWQFEPLAIKMDILVGGLYW